MPFGIEHTPSLDAWQKLRDQFAEEKSTDSLKKGCRDESEDSVKGSRVEPLYQLWHVGQSKFNGRDGEPLLVACMRNTRTGKEIPVLYSRAYGLDSLVHAHGARLIDQPAGWSPPVGVVAPLAGG